MRLGVRFDTVWAGCGLFRTPALRQKRRRTEHPSRSAFIRQVIMGTGAGA